MANGEIIIRLGGEGGEGVISAGDLFTAGAARTGYHVYTFRTYPSEIKGGHAWYQARVGPRPVYSMGDGIDVLVAFDAEAYRNHHELINPDGVLLYEADSVHPEGGAYHAYPVPFNQISKKDLDFFRGKNLVVLGVLSSLFGLDPSSLEGMIRARFARRAELLEKNLESLHYGYNYAQQNLTKTDPHHLGGGDQVQRLVMSGNEAIVAGALHSGCRFFAGYPITPASDIMEALAREMPKIGGAFLQAEDEMAALGYVLGASFAGVKAMTATSGPGFSLMTEMMGLASMAEIPAVLINAQRSGPSTGMPTKLEQADLNHALYGGHGDFPRIVMAATCVEDCFYQIIHAFNMAERFQMPVIFLSDQSLSHRTEAISMPDLNRVLPVSRVRLNGTVNGDYRRFALTDTGIVPMAIPGLDKSTYVTTGLEHDEGGRHVITPENHENMTHKRFAKLELARRELGPVPRYGVDKPEIGIIGWGSTEGPIREALERAVAAGVPVAALHPRVLKPLPSDQLSEFAASVRQIIVPEHNYTGQFGKYLRAELGINSIPLLKFGGLPFTPSEIYTKILEVAGATVLR